MPARTATSERAVPPFNSDLFNERCRALGATTEAERAALADVDPATLWRFRKGITLPNLRDARRFAQKVDLTVDDLWPAAA
jgi:DNA-binding XRE family transcriptional regulator